MAHHKRKRPKNRRAGCLLCKPHKMNGLSKEKKTKPSILRKLEPRNGPNGFSYTKLGK